MGTQVLSNGRVIGGDNPCYIIMDVAANHNNSLETAKMLVKRAAEAGADAIKLQTYTADKLYSQNTPQFSKDALKPYDLIKSVEHPREWLPILFDYSKECGIDFLSSPFDKEAINLLNDLNVPCFKVASSEIVDLDLIAYMASKGRAMIISTGMANLGEIEEAVDVCRKVGNDNISLLHCNTAYPTPIDIVNLRAMGTIGTAFKLPVGFSDHTLGWHISLAAVAQGAKIIEKHFTLDSTQEGPDHNFAIEPDNLKVMISNIRDVESAIGDGIKKVCKAELESYEKGRRSIIAACDISKDTKLKRDMLVIKRPGYGIKPNLIDIVSNRTAKQNIAKDDVITWEQLY